MKPAILFALILNTSGLFAQLRLTGKVMDTQNNALPGANVYIKGSYNGATTDTSGFFSFLAHAHDSDMLVVSYLGFKQFEIPVLKARLEPNLKIVLRESSNALSEVTVSAGTFEAGEKRRAVVLNPIEIATTAGTDGDIISALATFPGVTKQGETGKIIVRGGDSHESKTYIDGLLVSSPYTSSMPDLPARGRFTPFMFNGVMFSTGGYSAEYGQALSSVLELKTPGMFDEDITSVSIMNVGAGLGYTKRFMNSAFSSGINYSNLYPYFLMAKHDLDWIKVPQSFDGNFNSRIKTGKSGMLKADFNMNHGESILNYSKMSKLYKSVGLKNTNLFSKVSYNNALSDKWLFKAGYAYNYDFDKKDIGVDLLTEKIQSGHLRLGLTNYTTENITFRFGLEDYQLHYDFLFESPAANISNPLNVADNLIAAHAESDLKITQKIVLRLGFRSEYSTLTQQANLAPRASLAFKTGQNSQISVAAGNFYQQANYAYLCLNDSLKYENAGHLLLNYQWEKDNRIFRTEIYSKNYNSLVSYDDANNNYYSGLGNKGYGYARGIDLFFKDSKTIKYIEYWVSYSYLDTKRNYKNYECLVTPEFVSAHNLNVIAKYWVQAISTQISLTYSFASGRPYNNPNEKVFMAGRTESFNDLSASLSYITHIAGNFAVVHLAVSNVFGQTNTYGYAYSLQPDSEGIYQSTPIKSMVQRTVILGLFISIK